MSTRIDAIFADLAAMPVVFDEAGAGSYAIVTTYNLSSLPESVYDSTTPCRLLLTLGTRTEARSITPMTLTGAIATIGWKITDLFLLKPVGLTGGLAKEAPTLLRYIKAYFDAVQGIGFKLAKVAVVENITFEMTIVTYPPESDSQFFAVEVTLYPKEIAQP